MAVFRYSSPLLVRPRRMPTLSIATKPPALGNSNKARCRLFEQSFAAHIEQNELALVARPGPTDQELFRTTRGVGKQQIEAALFLNV
jgi:hypothetical protein